MDMTARPTRPLRTTVAALAAGVLLLAACGDDEASTDDTASDGRADAPPDEGTVAELDGREFVSSEVEGRELAAGSVIRLTFTGEELGIAAGCNSMGGAYAITDGVLTVSQLFTTEMACEEQLMEQDAWLAEFLSALSGEVAYAIEGDQLALTNVADPSLGHVLTAER